MKAEVSDIHPWKKRIAVEVPPEEVNETVEIITGEFQKKAVVEGFRKGKAPRSIISQRYAGAIREEASDRLIEHHFWTAAKENRIHVVDAPRVTEISFDEGQPFRFTAEVEVYPDVTLSDYKGVKVAKPIFEVTDDDVEGTLFRLREEQAQFEPVPDGAQNGHILVGDVRTLDPSGVPILGRTIKDGILTLGEPPATGDVEKQLLGVKVGDVRRFDIRAERPASDQPAVETFSIEAQKVLKKILPELDDAFAQKVSDKATVDELKTLLHERLKASAGVESERELRYRLQDEIIRRNDFELPPALVNNTLDSAWEEEKKKKDADEESFRSQNRPYVEWNLKWQLLSAKLVELENISIPPEEIQAEIDKAAQRDPKTEKKVRAFFQREENRHRLESDLLESKVFEFLKSNAKIKEETVKRKDRRSVITPS